MSPPCPSLEQLRRLLAEQVQGSEGEALEVHVETCTTCQRVLEDLLNSNRAVPDLIQVPTAITLSPNPGGEGPAMGFLVRLQEKPPEGPRGQSALVSGLEPTTAGQPEAKSGAEWPTIPGYELLAELGRGGMGVVYKAHQVNLDRLVALKMVKAGALAMPEALSRFHKEAEAVARLQHANIVPVHEVGEHNGLPYFSLEYVEGGSLADRLAGVPMPPRQAATLLETLARAMHYAHGCGVVHRDLKPANVLLTADGTPRVTDFGLAKRLDREATETQSGAILGTPSYMAPEQAAGRVREVGPSADVYALGAILYTTLTGRPPFVGETPYDTLAQVLSLDPVAPRRLQPKVPRDLETICLKCLQKESSRRYASAAALAEDLQRFLSGRPILARRVGWTEQAVKWARRRPAVAALWCLSLVVAVLTGSGGLWLVLARAEQHAELVRGVEEALDKARDFAPESEGGGRDQIAWTAALAEVKKAGALLEQAEGDDDLQRRVRELWQDMQDEDRDRRMADKLENIRLQEFNIQEFRLDRRQADRDYAEAFRDYSIDVRKLPPDEAATRVCARPIKAELVAGLEHWAEVCRKVKPRPLDPDRLLTVVQLADPAPWRKRFHNALAREDDADLHAQTAETALTTLPAPTLVSLGNLLGERGKVPLAIKVLRVAQQKQPSDFLANYHLARWLRETSPPEWAEALRFYTGALVLRSDSAMMHMHLGFVLDKLGRTDESLAAFRQVVKLRKELHGATAHYNLGIALAKLGRLEEAIASNKEAILIRPNDANTHFNLGAVLEKAGRPGEAAATYMEAIRLRPDFPEAHCNLGLALAKLGRHKEAIPCFEETIRLSSDYHAIAHTGLGNALARLGRLDETIAAYKEAIRIEPDRASTHYNLGIALGKVGRPGEAIASYKEAIRLQPAFEKAYYSLGRALGQLGRWGEAITSFKEAIRLRPDHADSHYGLGIALVKVGRRGEAIASYKEAIRLQPDHVESQYELGRVLAQMSRPGEAIAAYKEVLRLSPDHVLAHCGLGLSLQRQGQFHEALIVLRRGHELAAKDPRYMNLTANYVRQCERWLELDGRLLAILSGQAQPADPAERIEFARLCTLKQLHGTAARFYEEAFAAKPELARQSQPRHRYDAACAGALAGCGRSKDANQFDAPKRRALRHQALAWLQTDLEFWTAALRSNPAPAQAQLRQVLQWWQADADLAGLREAAALAALPAEEQQAWCQLWADVASLLALSRQP